MLFILKGTDVSGLFCFGSAGKEIEEGKYCATGVLSSRGTGFPGADVGTLVP